VKSKEDKMSITDIYLWTLTAIALIGTVLNVKQQRVGFLFWMVSNLGFTVSNVMLQIYPVAFLFLVYFFLAVAGWRSWGKGAKEDLRTAAATIEIAD